MVQTSTKVDGWSAEFSTYKRFDFAYVLLDVAAPLGVKQSKGNKDGGFENQGYCKSCFPVDPPPPFDEWI